MRSGHKRCCFGLPLIVAGWCGLLTTSCHADHRDPPRTETVASARAAVTTTGSSTISSNFNGTAIAANRYLWLSAVAKVSGVPNQVVHLYVNGAHVRFTANSVEYDLPVPDARITIDPAATTASTAFNPNAARWETTLPSSWSGNALLSALAWQVPADLPGGTNPVSWSASFQSDVTGLTINWQWAAAVYTTLGSDYNSDQVKPVDGTHLSVYQNSDHAGTPEAFRSFVIGGARGGGGSNYTGSLSGTASVLPTSSLCAGVVCAPRDACHLAGACEPSTGECSDPIAPDGNSCDDGNGCTENDVCVAGLCTSGNPVTCSAMDQCHAAGTCDPATGTCSNPPKLAGSPCSDGNECNGAESCDGAGECDAGIPPPVDDGNPCTIDSCDPASGVSHDPAAAGSPCADADACNGEETCNGLGACSPGTPPNVNDDNPCTQDYCDPAVGPVHVPILPGTSCSDGNPCNGDETCNLSGHCAAGMPLILDDQNPCTADLCDPATGIHHDPVAPNAPCSDGNACNGEETCDASGQCVGGAPPVLDDGNPCTTDSCTPATGVVHKPVGAGTPCPDGDVCNGAETCDTAGACRPGAAPQVDDGNPCTIDACDAQHGVSHVLVPEGTPCGDDDVCTGIEVCDALGTCVVGLAPEVDDGNPCTLDSCDRVAGVSHAQLAAGTSCSDGNVCNGDEVCDAQGQCLAGVPLALDDGQPCTADTCDPTKGVTHLPMPVGARCSDGDPCNGDEVCGPSGECQPGFPPILDDGNPCTADGCNAESGITHSALGEGADCGDGDACNGLELCDAQGRCVKHEAEPVDDGNLCTNDWCDPEVGVIHEPRVGESCSDGDVCNGEEFCDKRGECLSSKPAYVGPMMAAIVIVPVDPCTIERCDPVLGFLNEPAAEGTPCGDVDECQPQGSCDGQGNCAIPPLQGLDDGNPCTRDECKPGVGVYHYPLSEADCDDGNPCNGQEWCSMGTCISYNPPELDDENPCTFDLCDPVHGVAHEPVAPGTECSDADGCRLVGVCTEAGECVAQPAPEVDDGNPCTIDACDVEDGISHQPVEWGTPCADGDACNGQETCDDGGVCRPADPPHTDDENPCTTDSCDPLLGVLHAPVAQGTICAQADACHGAGECDANGGCLVPPDPDVDDGNPCTVDLCDANYGVTHKPELAGFPCDDDDMCNGAETCDGLETCLPGFPVAIDDQNPCTDDSCDPVLGVSHHSVPGGTSCSNGNACDGVEACNSAGTCVPGPAPTVDDSDPCTADGCDPVHGVSHTLLPAGAPCPDDNACNGAETCDSQGICAAGPTPTLDDGNPCTIDQCDFVAGVTHVPAPEGRTCSDGNACNGMEICHAGTCVAGSPPVVDDSNPCTTDGCDPVNGVTHVPMTTGSCFADAVTWKWQPMGRPSPRDSAAVALDRQTGTLFVFGGVNAGVALGDLWRLSTETGAWAVSYTGVPPRAGASATFDQNGKLVLFGGLARSGNQDSFLDDTWSYDPQTDAWTRQDVALRPSVRAFAATAFHSGLGRMLVFGGIGPGTDALGDAWQWDGGSWTQRVDSGAPPARSHTAMAYDPARDRVVLFGGASGSVNAAPMNDCWELDASTSSWSVCAGSVTPPARLGHTMAYDALQHRILMFGGTASSPGALDDTWAYDGAGWIPMPPSAEPARAGQGGAYDEVAGVVRTFGGLTFSDSGLTTPAVADRWRLNGSGGWTPDQPVIAPAAVQLGLVYDPSSQSLVTAGRNFWASLWRYDTIVGRWSFEQPVEGTALQVSQGWNYGFLTLFYDAVADQVGTVAPGRPQSAYGPAMSAAILQLDGGAWTRRECSNGPELEWGFAMAHDLARNRLVMFGGNKSNWWGDVGCSQRTYEVDLATCSWTLVSIDPANLPSPRTGSVMVWDSTRGVDVLYGGRTLTGLTSDTWEYDGSSWHQVAVVGPNPGAREGGTISFDSTRGRVVLFGGRDSQGQPLDDTWEYDGAAGTWTQLPVAGDRPSPRWGAAMVFDRGRGLTVLMGGMGAGYVEHSDMWEWDGVSWQRRWYGASPTARSGGASAGTKYGSPALFGGVAGDGQRAFLQDTWFWRDGEWLSGSPPSTEAVSSQAFASISRWIPPARAGHALAGYLGRAVMFGGEGDGGVLDDTWTWTENRVLAVDSQRLGATSGGVHNAPDPHWDQAWCRYGQPHARTESAIAALSTNEWVLFGGETASGEVLDDTWAFYYNEEIWQEARLEPGPTPRSAHAMVLDEARGRILLFGGRDGAGGALNDTWEFDALRPTGSKWTKLSPAHYPPRRFGHAMWYDGIRGVIVLTGGTGNSASAVYRDVWEWDGSVGDWTPRMTVVPDAPRVGHSAFFDDDTGEGVVFGGLSYSADGRATSTYGDTVALVNSDGSNAIPLVYPDGTPCAGGYECESGFCADGVCCDSPCDGQCASCAEPDREGECVAVSGQPRSPREPCGGATICDGVCDGADRQQCHPPPIGTICSADDCSNGSHVLPGVCDAARQCAATTESCAPFGCDMGSCVHYCGASMPCSPGWFCGSSYPGDWVCAGEATLTGFQIVPDANVTVGQAVAMTATAVVPPANVGYSWWNSVVFRFSYTLGGNTVYPCGDYASASSCSFTPSVSGIYACRVEVRNYESPNDPDDDAELVLTVGKP